MTQFFDFLLIINIRISNKKNTVQQAEILIVQ
jgi:hypothetical protein